MKTVKIFEGEKYIVELHPLAPRPYWVIDKNDINPLHPVATFYDEERAVEVAKGERVI